MYCNCGYNLEMSTRQHELRVYLSCGACGRIHWTGGNAESAGERRERLRGRDRRYPNNGDANV